jgi:L-lactate utilization protein LutB
MATHQTHSLESHVKLAAQAVEKLTSNLRPMQDKLRADPYNADLRARVQSAKREIAKAVDDYNQLARTASTVAGGKNFSPA